RLRLAGHGVVEPDLRLRRSVSAAQCGLCAHGKRVILTDARGCSKRSVGGTGVSRRAGESVVGQLPISPFLGPYRRGCFLERRKAKFDMMLLYVVLVISPKTLNFASVLFSEFSPGV